MTPQHRVSMARLVKGRKFEEMVRYATELAIGGMGYYEAINIARTLIFGIRENYKPIYPTEKKHSPRYSKLKFMKVEE